MNTKVTVSNAHNTKENLIILSDIDDVAWAAAYLTKTESGFLRNAIKKEIDFIHFPRENNLLIVHFLKENGEVHISREDARISGNEILTLLSQYKADAVTLVNQQKINRTLDYLEGMVLGNYQFLKYINKKAEKSNTLREISVDKNAATSASVRQLTNVLAATLAARDLVNEPQSFLSAIQLSKEITTLGKAHGFSVKVLDKKKIEAEKMGGILAVNLGSETPPTFNILEWKPKKVKNKKPIILVGKGVVYDTGGLSLKPTSNSMDSMKSDMAGAAVIAGTMMAVASNKLPLHIIGLIPATDNRPGKNAFAPGDVITLYDGTTVEILNTDAEGRLLLADALHFAKRYKPELVVDFATLTGAAARAVGRDAISYMGTADRKIKDSMEKSGFNVYERLIEFPLWREYREQLKSNIADLNNLGGPDAGMITAGKFLEHFTDYPWLHFDIAGSAFIKNADNYKTKEGTGIGVRLMFDFLKNY